LKINLDAMGNQDDQCVTLRREIEVLESQRKSKEELLEF
jgi:hypothetical protein